MRWFNNMTRNTSTLLLFGLTKGAIVMQGSKTHFEQIPVSVVKKIAEEVHDVDGNSRTATRTPSGKLKPHRLPSLGKNGKRV
jgi:hypothetical protein